VLAVGAVGTASAQDDVDMEFDISPEAGEGDVIGDLADAQTGPRRIVVAEFPRSQKSWVRPSVLGVLSEQSDVELVGFKDVTIVAKRIGVDPTSAEGRRQLSKEMNLFGWIDGNVTDDGHATVTLTDGDGARLAWLKASGRSGGALNGYVEAHLWKAFGPYLSEAERRRQAIEAAKMRALDMRKAREDEQIHQRKLAAEREQWIAARLAESKKVAVAMAKARDAEFQRQVKLVEDRKAEQMRQQQEAALQRQREIEEQRRKLIEMRHQQQPAYAAPQPAYAAPQPAYGAQPAYGPQPAEAPPPAAPPDEPAPEGDAPQQDFAEWAAQRKAQLEAQEAAPQQ
jgi:hypothetical protein